ncbi:MAG TPA: cytochrome c3 family protein [Acidobacteriota bacterium]|nr:cytochrome c3 family protein [Acidobacteriota bacterium]
MFLSILGGLCIVLIAALAYGTRESAACDTCHYLDPFVRYWRASTHSEVTCQGCHDYSMADLARSTYTYLTGTYNPRPRANVPDEGCLASDCHEARLLMGMTEYRQGILFDHAVHLEKPLRGEKLRCTSCHNQFVHVHEELTSTHLTVNDKACFVCHFKDAGLGEAITGCDACHGMPKDPVSHNGFTFEHEPYVKLGFECKQCHTRIVEGDGSLVPGTCHACHNERDPQQHSREELHAIHVTTNGIDCFECHSDIEHGNYEMTGATDTGCETCHLNQHNRKKQLYMGIGAKNTADMPGVMFRQQVACTGCHTHVTPEGEVLSGQAKREAERAACVTCHGKGFDLMFDAWLVGSRHVIEQYQAYLTRLRSDLKTIGGGKKARTRAREALSAAEGNFLFVRDGRIPHNIPYALTILNTGADRLETEMKGIDPAYSPPDRGAGLKPENTCTVFCHGSYLQPETVRYEDGELPHQAHVEDMELACSSCHSVSEHGKTVINADVCAECH